MRHVAVLVCFLLVACGGSGEEGGPGELPGPQSTSPASVPGPVRSGDLPPGGGGDALTDAQIEKFIAAAREVEAIDPPDPTMESMKAWQSQREKVIQRHGMSEVEYGKLDVRMKSALTILGYGAPVPPELKADCEIAKRHLGALKSALRME